MLCGQVTFLYNLSWEQAESFNIFTDLLTYQLFFINRTLKNTSLVCYLFFTGFIGIAKDIVEIINHKNINDMDDDQLYYTKIFLDKNLRVSHV